MEASQENKTHLEDGNKIKYIWLNSDKKIRQSIQTPFSKVDFYLDCNFERCSTSCQIINWKTVSGTKCSMLKLLKVVSIYECYQV